MNNPIQDRPQASAELADSYFRDAIAARAYEKWVRRGRPRDTRLKDWQEAEAEVKDAYIGESIRAERRLVAEHAVARILNEAAEILDAAPQIVQAICESLGWDVGILWTVDRQAQMLRCVDVWRAPTIHLATFEQFSRQCTFSPGNGLPGRVWASKCPVWIPDMARDGDRTRTPIAATDGLHAARGFPIHNGMEFLGVMEFFSREIHQPDEECSR